MFTRQRMILPLTAVIFAAAASADSSVYVVTDSQQFGTVDLNTGAFQPIGSGTPEQTFNLVPGPNGSLFTLTASGNLDSINTTTGATTVIGSTGISPTIGVGDLAEIGRRLYATDFNNNLYTINPMTGAAHLIGPTGIPPLVFNPPTVSDESLYAVGGKLYLTSDTFDLPESDPVLVVPPTLYQIDPRTGAATKVASTMLNLSASVDAEGLFYAFKEVPADPTCVAAAPLSCASAAQIFTLDLANGSTSFVNDVDSSATAIYGAYPEAPEPASIALAGLGVVAIGLWKRRKRSL